MKITKETTRKLWNQDSFVPQYNYKHDISSNPSQGLSIMADIKITQDNYEDNMPNFLQILLVFHTFQSHNSFKKTLHTFELKSILKLNC